MLQQLFLYKIFSIRKIFSVLRVKKGTYQFPRKLFPLSIENLIRFSESSSLVGQISFILHSRRTIRDYSSENFRQVSFSVLDLVLKSPPAVGNGRKRQGSASRYWPTYADICRHLPTSADICRHLLTSADICRHCADFCRRGGGGLLRPPNRIRIRTRNTVCQSVFSQDHPNILDIVRGYKWPQFAENCMFVKNAVLENWVR